VDVRVGVEVVEVEVVMRGNGFGGKATTGTKPSHPTDVGLVPSDIVDVSDIGIGDDFNPSVLLPSPPPPLLLPPPPPSAAALVPVPFASAPTPPDTDVPPFTRCVTVVNDVVDDDDDDGGETATLRVLSLLTVTLVLLLMLRCGIDVDELEL
jgi:hypothetical protein